VTSANSRSMAPAERLAIPADILSRGPVAILRDHTRSNHNHSKPLVGHDNAGVCAARGTVYDRLGCRRDQRTLSDEAGRSLEPTAFQEWRSTFASTVFDSKLLCRARC
jgi:hypothetical protein